jgi:hypothetical protein
MEGAREGAREEGARQGAREEEIESSELRAQAAPDSGGDTNNARFVIGIQATVYSKN